MDMNEMNVLREFENSWQDYQDFNYEQFGQGLGKALKEVVIGDI